MPTSDVDICKRALVKLGADTITSLGEDKREARACNRVYDTCRDALLRAHPWNFAIARTNLAADPTAPDWGYDYKFQLPSDCLKLLEVREDDGAAITTEYQLEGRMILSDHAGPLYIRYIFQETNPAQFDSLFVEALASKIAFELAEELTQNNQKKITAGEDLKMAMREAKRIDAQENPPEDNGDTDWWDARL